MIITALATPASLRKIVLHTRRQSSRKRKNLIWGHIRVFAFGMPTILQFLAFSLPFQQPETSKNGSRKNPTGKAGTLDSHFYWTFRAMGLKITCLKCHIYVRSSQEHTYRLS